MNKQAMIGFVLNSFIKKHAKISPNKQKAIFRTGIKSCAASVQPYGLDLFSRRPKYLEELLKRKAIDLSDSKFKKNLTELATKLRELLKIAEDYSKQLGAQDA